MNDDPIGAIATQNLYLLAHKLQRDEILKSLGLYWRVWPEEKPENPEGLQSKEFIIKEADGLIRTAIYHFYNEGFWEYGIEPIGWMEFWTLEKLP